jgi:hypothetical protein
MFDSCSVLNVFGLDWLIQKGIPLAMVSGSASSSSEFGGLVPSPDGGAGAVDENGLPIPVQPPLPMYRVNECRKCKGVKPLSAHHCSTCKSYENISTVLCIGFSFDFLFS